MDTNEQTNIPKVPVVVLKRPGIKGMSMFMNVLRVLFFIKGLLLLVLGMVLLSSNSFLQFATESLGSPFNTTDSNNKDLLDFIMIENTVLGITILLLATLFLFSAWLCKRVILRNEYILGLETRTVK